MGNGWMWAVLCAASPEPMPMTGGRVLVDETGAVRKFTELPER